MVAQRTKKVVRLLVDFGAVVVRMNNFLTLARCIGKSRERSGGVDFFIIKTFIVV